MKEIIRVFCDVTGTFTSNSEDDRTKLISQLMASLNDLALKSNAIVVFSFLSDLNCDELKPYISELITYLPSNVLLGKQFAFDGYIKEEEIIYERTLFKPLLIQEELLKEKNISNVKEVFYFDDNAIYINAFNEDVGSSIPITSFAYQVNGGLKDLTAQLNSYITDDDYGQSREGNKI